MVEVGEEVEVVCVGAGVVVEISMKLHESIRSTGGTRTFEIFVLFVACFFVSISVSHMFSNYQIVG